MTNTETPTTSKLETVRALLAKAEATNFPEEAEAFRAKATELMAKYEFSEAQVWANSKATDRDIVLIQRTAEEPYAPEKLTLWWRIGEVFGVKSVFVRHDDFPKRRGYAYIDSFGTQSAHDLTELLITSIMVQAANQISNVKADVGPKERSRYAPSTRALRLAFLAGFFDRCAYRIKQAHSESIFAEAKTEPGNALVLVRDAERAQKALEDANPRLGKGKKKGYDTQGLSMGRAAGNNAYIGTTSLGGRSKALNA